VPLGAVRGLGLLIGIELDRPAGPVVDAALALGLVVGTAGERTLRLAPPLTISAEEAAQALDLLTEAAHR
jgi:4-aminobutyrate aminotransferase-like enzyme